MMMKKMTSFKKTN